MITATILKPVECLQNSALKLCSREIFNMQRLNLVKANTGDTSALLGDDLLKIPLQRIRLVYQKNAINMKQSLYFRAFITSAFILSW